MADFGQNKKIHRYSELEMLWTFFWTVAITTHTLYFRSLVSLITE